MKMRKSILSLAVSLSAVSLLFAGNVFASDGQPPKSESDSITPELITTGTCAATKKTSFATNDINASTALTTFSDIPGMVVSFVIPGVAFTCFTVDYSAQAFAPGGSAGLMMVRAVLDGVVVGTPGEYQFVGGISAANDVYSDSYSNQWVFTNVAPGFHTVRIQFRSFFGGVNTVHINKGMMTVQHK